MIRLTLRRSLLTLTAFAAVGCSTDLNVTNPNNPDVERALAVPEDVRNLAISSMNSWYLTSTDVYPYMMMGVTADMLAANFGNFGMRFNNVEPRIPYENSSAGTDRQVAENTWLNNYSTLGAANDAIAAMDRGVEISGGNLPWRALARFVQAATLTNLALTYDQAFAVDEDTTVAISEGLVPSLQPYENVAQLAREKWDALNTEIGAADFTYDAAVFPTTTPLTMQGIKRLGNTMAALLLAYTPRGASDVAGVNWNDVLAYTNAGIGTAAAGAPFDLVVTGDNNNWFSLIAYYGNEHSWVRVDHRLIRLMDGTTTAPYNGTPSARGTSADARYVSDFHRCGTATNTPPGDGIIPGANQNCGVTIGDPGRGIFMQSNWMHKRYAAHARTSPGATRAIFPVPYILAAESDLARAEALIRTGGSLAEAATLINNSRVTRGNLPAATAGDGAATLLGYIEYERQVELLNTNGWELFRLRHTDLLQPGTVRHLPVPARELETLGLPVYTFGGVGSPDRSRTLGVPTAAALMSWTSGATKEIMTPSGALELRFPKTRSFNTATKF